MTRSQKSVSVLAAVAIVGLCFVLFELRADPDVRVQGTLTETTPATAEESTKDTREPVVPIPFDGEDGAFLVRVHDKDSMQPVQARLVAHKSHTRKVTKEDMEFDIHQDLDGFIRVDPADWRPMELSYSVFASGYVPKAVTELSLVGVNLVGLTQDAESVLKFVDQQGVPVPRVRVQLSSIRLAQSDVLPAEGGDAGLAIGKLGICEAWSNSDGVAVIQGLPAGEYWALIEHETHLALAYSGSTRFALARGEQTIEMGEVWGAVARVRGIPVSQFTISTGGGRVEYRLRGASSTWDDGLLAFTKRLRRRLGKDVGLIRAFVPSGYVDIGNPITNVPFSVTPVGGRTTIHQVPSFPMSLIHAPEDIWIDPPTPASTHPLRIALRQPDGSLFSDFSNRFTISGKIKDGEGLFLLLDSPEQKLPLGTYSLSPTPVAPLSGFLPARRFEVVSGPNELVIDLPMRIDSFLMRIATSVRERPAMYTIDTIADGKVVTRSYTNLDEERIVLASTGNWEVEIGAEGFKSARRVVSKHSATVSNSDVKTLEFLLEPLDS